MTGPPNASPVHWAADGAGDSDDRGWTGCALSLPVTCYRVNRCCSPADALDIAGELARMALDSDADALRCLPAALDHWLQAVSR